MSKIFQSPTHHCMIKLMFLNWVTKVI